MKHPVRTLQRPTRAFSWCELYEVVPDDCVAVADPGALRSAMASYRVVPASRITGVQKRIGWVVERFDVGDLPSAASILFATEREAEAEAKNLIEITAKQSVAPFIRYR